MGGTPCDDCEEATATQFCDVCELSFCSPCFTALHDEAGITDHTTHAIAVEPPPLPVAPPPRLPPPPGAELCDECEKYASEFDCLLCEMAYCNVCWDDVHVAGNMLRHDRNPLGSIKAAKPPPPRVPSKKPKPPPPPVKRGSLGSGAGFGSGTPTGSGAGSSSPASPIPPFKPKPKPNSGSPSSPLSPFKPVKPFKPEKPQKPEKPEIPSKPKPGQGETKVPPVPSKPPPELPTKPAPELPAKKPKPSIPSRFGHDTDSDGSGSGGGMRRSPSMPIGRRATMVDRPTPPKKKAPPPTPPKRTTVADFNGDTKDFTLNKKPRPRSMMDDKSGPVPVTSHQRTNTADAPAVPPKKVLPGYLTLPRSNSLNNKGGLYERKRVVSGQFGKKIPLYMPGDRVMVNYLQQGDFYPAVVVAVSDDGLFDVDYDEEGYAEENVEAENIQMEPGWKGVSPSRYLPGDDVEVEKNGEYLSAQIMTLMLGEDRSTICYEVVYDDNTVEEGVPAERVRDEGSSDGGSRRRTLQESSPRILTVSFDDDIYSKPFTANDLQVTPTKGEAQVRAGRVEALVALAAHADFEAPEYVKCFLATFPTFTTASETLKLLRIRANDRRYREAVLDLLEQWIIRYPLDFAPGKSGDQREVLQDLLLAPIWGGLEGRLQKLGNMLQQVVAKPPRVPDPVVEFSLEDKVPKELNATTFAAAVITLDEELFNNIDCREFLRCAWSRTQKEEEAPNLLAFIRHSTRVSSLVANLVLHETKARKRAARVEMFIEAAICCRAYDDYAGITAIITGLRQNSVYRLRKTWDLVHPRLREELDDLDDLMARSNNNHRRLRSAVLTADTCIPHVGIYLTDLTFNEDGNPDLISSRWLSLKLDVSQADVHAGMKKITKKKPKLVTRRFDGQDGVEAIWEAFGEIYDKEKLAAGKLGMFVPSPERGEPGLWLVPGRRARIFDYDMFGGETVQLRMKHQPIQYSIMGDLACKVILDNTMTCEEIVTSLIRRFQMEDPSHFHLHVDVPLDPNKCLWEQGVREAEVVELRVAVPLEKVPSIRNDSRLLELLYSDMRSSVFSGMQPVNDHVANILVLLQLQVDFGHRLQLGKKGQLQVEAGSSVGTNKAEVLTWTDKREADLDWYLAKLNVWPSEGEGTSFEAKRQCLVRELEELERIAVEEGKKQKAKDKEPPWEKYLLPQQTALLSSSKETSKWKATMAELFTQQPQRMPDEAREAYIVTIKTLPTADGRFFPAKRRNAHAEGKKAKKMDMWYNVFIGITPTEIIMLDQQKTVSERHLLEEMTSCVRDGVVVTYTVNSRPEPISVHLDEVPTAQGLVNLTNKRQRMLQGSQTIVSHDVEIESEEIDEVLLVNFTKRMRCGAIVNGILDFQRRAEKRARKTAIVTNDKVKALVAGFSGLAENELHEVSESLETRSIRDVSKEERKSKKKGGWFR